MVNTFAYPYFGYNPPFFGGHQNVLSRQANERIIKNDLLQLLMTSPGERVMRPTFGTILQKSLFEPMTSDLILQIQMSIDSAIATYETRIRASASITTDPDNNTLRIILAGNYTNQPNVEFLQEVDLQLPTTGA